jgi:hypothetical protein
MKKMEREFSKKQLLRNKHLLEHIGAKSTFGITNGGVHLNWEELK